MNILLLFLILPAIIFAQTPCSSPSSGIIWCDDFEDETPLSKKYFEYDNNNGDFTVIDGVGVNGSKGIRVRWQKGEVGAGSLKKSFGRTPGTYIGKNAASPENDFNEIFWRMDVKNQEGWTGGGPAKLSRALVLANNNWATGMMAHLWSGGANNLYLGMDPASGVSANGQLKSTKYNDFENLRWLGFKAGNIDLYSSQNSGRWFCIEGHVKLNTPGKSDGIFEFWINDTLQASSYNLNWHGDWNTNPSNMMINAIFFENYWNSGSPVEQERYFDNLIISRERIGCSDITSIEESPSTSTNIHPNPADDYIIVEHKYKEYTILNVTGAIIDKGACKGRIDLNDIPPGLYIIKLSNGSGFTKFEIFIKL